MKGSISRKPIVLLAAAWLAVGVTNAWAVDAAEADRQSFKLDAGGAWQPLQTPAPPAPNTPADQTLARDPDLARIAQLVKNGQFQQSRDESLAWLLRNKGNPLFDRGLYLMAASLRGTREYIKGFYYCDELLDEHTDSALYQDALQLQYEIANAYLLGAKDRFVGLRILGRQDEALDMLFRIQTRAPASPVAENALLRTADYYYATDQFDLAADAYRAFTTTYPRNPIGPEARLREAQATLDEFRSAVFDSTPLLNARELFRRFKAEYPEMASQRKVDDQLAFIDQQLARKLYEDADFYRRTGKKTAAIAVCRRLIAQYPNLPQADDAKQMLNRLGAA